MLMAAATHLGGSAAHSSSSSSSISPPPPPWLPVVLVPNPHQQALYDQLDLVTPSPSPSPTAPQSLRPAARRAGKQRRPRPSRKLPTTYISADAASFRRMVHQVTGADDEVAAHQAAAELLCSPAPAPPSRSALTTTTMATATLLPTLDTSAFLLGAAPRGGDSGRTPPLARPGSTSSCHGSAVAAAGDPGAALLAEEACGSGCVRGGGGGEYSCSNGSGGGDGFPSLELWDDDAMFQE